MNRINFCIPDNRRFTMTTPLDGTGTDIPAGKTDAHARGETVRAFNVHEEIELAHVAIADLVRRALRTNEKYLRGRLEGIDARLHRIGEHIDDLERARDEAASGMRGSVAETPVAQPARDIVHAHAQAKASIIGGKKSEVEDKMDHAENTPAVREEINSVLGKIGGVVDQLKRVREWL